MITKLNCEKNCKLEYCNRTNFTYKTFTKIRITLFSSLKTFANKKKNRTNFTFITFTKIRITLFSRLKTFANKKMWCFVNLFPIFLLWISNVECSKRNIIFLIVQKKMTFLVGFFMGVQIKIFISVKKLVTLDKNFSNSFWMMLKQESKINTR